MGNEKKDLMKRDKEKAAEKFIDLEKVIGKKNPKLLRLLPGFFINYLKRTIHQEDINSFIRRNGHLYDFDFVDAIIREFGAKVTAKGIENIPKKGGYILAANHPLGGLDGMSILHEVGKRRKDVKLVVNDILMNLVNLKNLFMPVNKHGRNSPEVAERLENLFASDELAIVFPAGLVSRKQKGGIRDLQWKKSFITKAKKNKKSILPVYVDGGNSAFFYNLAKARKNIGIKANIEMFFLPNEMYKQHNKSITVIFGKPITFSQFHDGHRDHYWAQKVKDHVYALGEGKPLPLETEKNQ